MNFPPVIATSPFRLLALTCLLAIGCQADPPPPELKPGPIDADADTEWTQTPSGLKYRVLRKGDGPTPEATDWVEVHYRGWLSNDEQFDSSYERGSHFTTPLTNVIPGWTEGLQYCRKGGMIELEIPSELGYGSRGSGADIPPDSTLFFQIELLKIFTIQGGKGRVEKELSATDSAETKPEIETVDEPENKSEGESDTESTEDG